MSNAEAASVCTKYGFQSSQRPFTEAKSSAVCIDHRPSSLKYQLPNKRPQLPHLLLHPGGSQQHDRRVRPRPLLLHRPPTPTSHLHLFLFPLSKPNIASPIGFLLDDSKSITGSSTPLMESTSSPSAYPLIPPPPPTSIASFT
ncbi:hypothetical protein MRB53_015225 [Persea americana]|uniref:Uncharacterized protein n=1 Tax=Persea americana TaxID=3435 RepID=A0ACC2KD56_PERAE|nr:hypothetical protein MRB53_015225 [Persea americana]